LGPNQKANCGSHPRTQGLKGANFWAYGGGTGGREIENRLNYENVSSDQDERDGGKKKKHKRNFSDQEWLACSPCKKGAKAWLQIAGRGEIVTPRKKVLALRMTKGATQKKFIDCQEQGAEKKGKEKCKKGSMDRSLAKKVLRAIGQNWWEFGAPGGE